MRVVKPFDNGFLVFTTEPGKRDRCDINLTRCGTLAVRMDNGLWSVASGPAALRALAHAILKHPKLQPKKRKAVKK